MSQESKPLNAISLEFLLAKVIENLEVRYDQVIKTGAYPKVTKLEFTNIKTDVTKAIEKITAIQDSIETTTEVDDTIVKFICDDCLYQSIVIKHGYKDWLKSVLNSRPIMAELKDDDTVDKVYSAYNSELEKRVESLKSTWGKFAFLAEYKDNHLTGLSEALVVLTMLCATNRLVGSSTSLTKELIRASVKLTQTKILLSNGLKRDEVHAVGINGPANVPLDYPNVITHSSLQEQSRMVAAEAIKMGRKFNLPNVPTKECYVSPRNIPLLAQTTYDKPILTAEACTKWYTLFLLNPDGSVEEVTAAGDSKACYDLIGTPYIDHNFHPMVFDVMAVENDWYGCELAKEVAAGRWIIEYGSISDLDEIDRALDEYEMPEKSNTQAMAEGAIRAGKTMKIEPSIVISTILGDENEEIDSSILDKVFEFVTSGGGALTTYSSYSGDVAQTDSEFLEQIRSSYDFGALTNVRLVQFCEENMTRYGMAMIISGIDKLGQRKATVTHLDRSTWSEDKTVLANFFDDFTMSDDLVINLFGNNLSALLAKLKFRKGIYFSHHPKLNVVDFNLLFAELDGHADNLSKALSSDTKLPIYGNLGSYAGLVLRIGGEKGTQVKLPSTFKCTVNGVKYDCVTYQRKEGGGHGEGTWHSTDMYLSNCETGKAVKGVDAKLEINTWPPLMEIDVSEVNSIKIVK